MAEVSNGGQSTSATISRARKRPQASEIATVSEGPGGQVFRRISRASATRITATILSGRPNPPAEGADPRPATMRRHADLRICLRKVRQEDRGHPARQRGEAKFARTAEARSRRRSRRPRSSSRGAAGTSTTTRARSRRAGRARRRTMAAAKKAKKPRRRRIPSRTPIRRPKRRLGKTREKREIRRKTRQEKNVKATVLFRGIRAFAAWNLRFPFREAGQSGLARVEGGRQCCSPRSHSRRKSPRTRPRAVNRLGRARIPQRSVASVPISVPARIRLGWSRVGRPIRGPRGTCRTGAVRRPGRRRDEGGACGPRAHAAVGEPENRQGPRALKMKRGGPWRSEGPPRRVTAPG